MFLSYYSRSKTCVIISLFIIRDYWAVITYYKINFILFIFYF